MGGLGNQMFQYAFGLMLVNKFEQQVCLDISWFNYHTNRKLNLKEFKPILKFRKRDVFFIILGNILIWLSEHFRFIRMLRPVFHLRNIEEYICSIEQKFIYTKIQGRNFNLDMLKNNKNYYLEGYWQNPEYFEGIRKTILKNFSFPKLKNFEDSRLQNKISDSESIAIHIRRGDYIKNPTINQFHGTCSLEYYKKAAELIASKVTNAKFFLFTDDPNFVKDNFGFLPNTTLVSDSNRSDIDELNLMHSCKHFIIANSTFSWWGAWLSQHPEKIVVAPKQWFKNVETNKKCKIIPKDWTRI